MDDLKHYEKGINQEYSINKELWTKRLYEVEKQDFPDYNDRIFYLCQDAKWSYVYGLPKGSIMYLSLAAEQILKNIFLKINNHSKEIYEKIEGKENNRGKTFGSLISEIKKTDFVQNEEIINIFENINKIRNKSAAHLKFVGNLNKEKNNLFEQYINYLKDLKDNFENINNYFIENNILNLIEKKEFKLINYQNQIEFEVDMIFAKKLIKYLQEINQKLNLKFIDIDKFSKILRQK